MCCVQTGISICYNKNIGCSFVLIIMPLLNKLLLDLLIKLPIKIEYKLNLNQSLKFYLFTIFTTLQWKRVSRISLKRKT